MLNFRDSKGLECASYPCPSPLEEKMSKSHIKGTLLAYAISTPSSLSPGALLLGPNLFYTFSLLGERGKLGLLSKDLDSSRENYGDGGRQFPCPGGTPHIWDVGNRHLEFNKG